MNNTVIEQKELVQYDRGQAELGANGPATWDARPPQAEDYISLAAAWHIIFKRRWTILTTAAVLVTLAAFQSFRATPIYKATARVEVEAETPTIQSLNNLYQSPAGYTDDVFVQTQIEVLKSDTLAWRTVEQLHLGDNPKFASPQDDRAKAEDPAARKAQLISALKGGLSVELVPKTRMLVVGFESADPQLAASVATAHVNNYVDYNFREKYNATRQASGWMEQQLDELKAKVEHSQQALVDYERAHSIANTGEKQNVQEQMLSDVSKDLTAAQSERIQKESLYNQVKDSRDQMAGLVHNELLQKLEEKQADLQNQYAEVVNQYGPKFPKAVRMQQQVAENQRQLEQERNRVLERIRSDYVTAVNRERLAAAAVGKQKADLGQVNQTLVQQNILQREFETNQQMYQNLLQRLKDATVSAGLRSTNIHLVDTALTPTAPIRPRRTMNIAVGLIAGLVLGVILAFGQEALDQSIKTVEELEAIVSAPALGVLPADRSGHLGYGLRRGSRRSDDAQTGETALAVTERPTSVLAEAYRSLRTAILLSRAGRPPKTILVTSAQAGEGKTSTALNLAQVLAQRDVPVVLVDCDLRKGGVAKAGKFQNNKGVSTVLAGRDELADALQPYEGLPNLWVLASGPVPPQPAELLSSEKMTELINHLRERFQHVVIDSPPVLAVTDAVILSRLTEGVLVVAEGGRTTKAALVRTHRVLGAVGARILGVALNKFDIRKAGYYGSYYPYYGEGKGYPYGATAD